MRKPLPIASVVCRIEKKASKAVPQAGVGGMPAGANVERVK